MKTSAPSIAIGLIVAGLSALSPAAASAKSQNGSPLYVVVCNDSRGELTFFGAGRSAQTLTTGDFEKPTTFELTEVLNKKPLALVPRHVVQKNAGTNNKKCKGNYLRLYAKNGKEPLSLNCASGQVKTATESPEAIFKAFDLSQEDRDCSVMMTAEQVRTLTRE